MFSTLIRKEILAIIAGPKFIATFLICSILILLSVFIGIQEYRIGVKSYQAGSQLSEQELQNLSSWSRFSLKLFRKPEPLQIFISGVNNDVGRLTTLARTETTKLSNSAFSDNPIFAMFRLIDLNTIIMIILSLFAILFTYDAISGEKENGTLRLAFSNSVPKLHYILAKCIGSWIGMMAPLIIPMLLSLLFVFIFQVPFTGDHWLKTLLFLGVSILYLTFFIISGILISALTKQSNISFLLLLVIWVILVLIVPRLGVMVAGNIISVPAIAEIDGQIDGFSKNQRANFVTEIQNLWQKRNRQMQGMTEDEAEQYRNIQSWNWILKEDSLRRDMQIKIDEFSKLVYDDLRNRKIAQERLAFALSRLSPVSAYQLCAMNLAETDIHLKSRYETSLENYKKTLLAYTDKKERESGSTGGIRISFSSATGMNINMGRHVNIDLSELPRFYEANRTPGQLCYTSLLDIALLIFYAIAALLAAIITFLKYDVR